ncbi:MAG: NAD(P)H-dependent oxidoreductase [Phototrophicales bacterium]
MNVLIVYAHPEPKSFDADMRDRAVQILTREGHAVVVSDLYAMRFKAQLDADDFTDPADEIYFNLQKEQLHAAETGTFAADILAEQRKLLWSNMLILQFPLWWYSVPAIMKGWIDRVLAYGFAYGQGRNLKGRRAMLVMTTGGQVQPFTMEKQNILSAMLDHVQRGTLHFCGFDVLPPFAVYGAANANADQREQFMVQYTQLLRGLHLIDPIAYG